MKEDKLSKEEILERLGASATKQEILNAMEEYKSQSSQEGEIERLKDLAEYWEGCHREVGKDLIKIQQENNQLLEEELQKQQLNHES